MALTTHEKIRVVSGFQSRFSREAFRNPTGISTNAFFVNSDDNVKFVPEFGTGNTIAGISDVQVYLGLSGVYGVSQLGVSSIDISQGSVLLSLVPPLGCSLTISYSSSAITSRDVEDVRLEAEAIINQRLALCYDMPVSSSSLVSLASRLAAAFLLIRGYGVGANRDLAADGYRLYAQLLGDPQMDQANTKMKNTGEIGLICTPNFQLVDDGGNIIPRMDSGINGTDTFTVGGRVDGRIYDPTEEPFRKKDWQENVNRDQAGSGVYPNSTTISPW